MKTPTIQRETAEAMVQCIREQQRQIEAAHRILFEQQIKINRLTAELKSAQETAEQLLDILMQQREVRHGG